MTTTISNFEVVDSVESTTAFLGWTSEPESVLVVALPLPLPLP
jgi:hypothetical protein